MALFCTLNTNNTANWRIDQKDHSLSWEFILELRFLNRKQIDDNLLHNLIVCKFHFKLDWIRKPENLVLCTIFMSSLCGHIFEYLLGVFEKRKFMHTGFFCHWIWGSYIGIRIKLHQNTKLGYVSLNTKLPACELRIRFQHVVTLNLCTLTQ